MLTAVNKRNLFIKSASVFTKRSLQAALSKSNQSYCQTIFFDTLQPWKRMNHSSSSLVQYMVEDIQELGGYDVEKVEEDSLFYERQVPLDTYEGAIWKHLRFSKHKRDLSLLFGVVDLPSERKHKKIEPEKKEREPPISWYKELDSRLERCYPEQSSTAFNDFGQLEFDTHLHKIFEDLKEKTAETSFFPFMIRQMVAKLVHDKYSIKAMMIFKQYTETVKLTPQDNIPNPLAIMDFKKSYATAFMARLLRKEFSKNHNLEQLKLLKRLFDELEYDDNGEIEADLTVEYARAGLLNQAKNLLEQSIINHKHPPTIKLFNKLLAISIQSTSSNSLFTEEVLCYMDTFSAGSDFPDASLTAQSIILRSKLCRNTMDVLNLIELADHNLLLQNFELQLELFRTALQFIKESSGLHILHGVISRFRRQRFNYQPCDFRLPLLPINPHVEILGIQACCSAQCAIGAIQIFNNMLSRPSTALSDTSLLSVQQSILRVICEHPKLQHFSWKEVTSAWLESQFYVKNEWVVKDHSILPYVLKTSVLLNRGDAVKALFVPLLKIDDTITQLECFLTQDQKQDL